MDNENNDQNDQKKPLVNRLILAAGKPVQIDTEALGRIEARWLTLKGRGEFQRRLKGGGDNVPDDELIRAYVGCVSGYPVEGASEFPAFLTEEEVGKLTERDIETFAIAYLGHVAEQPEGDEPIHALAEYIRREVAKIKESQKKLAETIQSLNLNASAQIMKNWGGLDNLLGNKVTDFAKGIKEAYGPLFAANDRFGDTLKSLTEIIKPLSTLEALKRPVPDPHLLGRSTLTPVKTMPDIDFAEVLRNSPEARTARSTENLNEVAGKMSRAVDALLEHAGTATLDIRNVLDTIQVEAEKSGKLARRALWTSIGTAILVIVISVVGIWVSHRDASNDGASRRQAEAMEAQNDLLKSLLEEARKESIIPVPPETDAPASSGSTPKKSPEKH
jgi:hypothetical protein